MFDLILSEILVTEFNEWGAILVYDEVRHTPYFLSTHFIYSQYVLYADTMCTVDHENY